MNDNHILQSTQGTFRHVIPRVNGPIKSGVHNPDLRISAPEYGNASLWEYSVGEERLMCYKGSSERLSKGRVRSQRAIESCGRFRLPAEVEDAQEIR